MGQINMIFSMLNIATINSLDIAKAESHIAMGNKDFLMRNRSKIQYDQRWFHEDGIQLSYLLNHAARSLNKSMHQLSLTHLCRWKEGSTLTTAAPK